MLKRIFSFLIFIFVSFISFFLTSLSVKSIRELDPILILIKKNNNEREVKKKVMHKFIVYTVIMVHGCILTSNSSTSMC